MKRTPIKRRKPLRSKRWPPESPREPFAASTPAALEPQDNRRVAGRTALVSREHKPQRKEHGRITLTAPTVAQRRRWRLLREQAGCIACRRQGREAEAGEAIEIHHLLMRGSPKRLGHDETIPLCVQHHRHGTPDRPSRHGEHGGRVAFEAHVRASETELLAECNALLEKANG